MLTKNFEFVIDEKLKVINEWIKNFELLFRRNLSFLKTFETKKKLFLTNVIEKNNLSNINEKNNRFNVKKRCDRFDVKSLKFESTLNKNCDRKLTKF